MVEPTKKTVSLVLGGGGARGYAHVGVIRAIEEHGLSVRSVVGCSMGALVGGIYAMGKLAEFEAWARNVDRRQIFSLLDFSFGRGAGLVKGDKVISALRNLCGEVRIEDLGVRYTAIASDLVRQREVWIDRGPLFDAIRASISLPMIFTPVEREGTRLVDGGIFNPVPVAPTFRDATDLTIAVSMSGPPTRSPAETPRPDDADAGFWARFLKRAQGREENGARAAERAWNLSYVAIQSIDAMQGIITRQRLAANAPEVLIEVPRDSAGLMEFDRADELIALGYELAKRRLEEHRAGR